jgi:hypothetical protein
MIIYVHTGQQQDNFFSSKGDALNHPTANGTDVWANR